MKIVDTLKIKAFGPMPEADESILEIPLADLQGLLKALVETYNQIAEIVRDAGILRGPELARVTEHNNKALMAERSPLIKMLLLDAYIRQHLTRIRDALQSRPAEAGKVVQVVSKIAARAIQIIDHVRVLGSSQSKTVSLDSSQARMLIAGKEGEQPSRRDTIRAMRRAEKLCPALECDHRPGDGRQTMRLTGSAKDLLDCDIWQRSGLTV